MTPCVAITASNSLHKVIAALSLTLVVNSAGPVLLDGSEPI
jgi:hypothetical protein